MKRIMLSAIVPLIAAFAIAVTPAMPVGATSGPTCLVQDTIWPCAQVFGNGDNIVQMNGWANNTSNVQIDNLHIEFVFVDPSGQSYHILNCGEFDLAPQSNSPNCIWAPNGNVATGNWCAQVWQHISGSNYRGLGRSCVGVHP